MDADRFDALSRALTTAPSRRTTLGALLGALLGSVLPGLSADTGAAARKRNGKTRHGHASRTHHRHQPHSRDVTDEQTRRRTEATELASGEVRASDVSAAACVAPGAKGCPKTACCATKCKKKKKCLPCPTGTTYCASQEQCVDSAQFDTLCTDDGGTCTTNNDCCPSGGCTSSTSLYKTCSNGSCVCEVAHPDYPNACDWPPNPSQCHQCCNNDDCVVRFDDPNRVCLNGNCVCDGNTPTLCTQKFEGGKNYCTDPRSDPENCSPFVETCGPKCAAGWACINGTCTFQSGV